MSDRHVRPGNAEEVVAARVHDHVVPLLHVAGDALGARRAGRVVMVRGGVVLLRRQRRKARIGMRLMAAHAERIPLGAERRGVRVVTIGAANAALIHLALPERAVFVDFVVDLPVGEVERLAHHLRHELVEERVGQPVRRADPVAAGVTGRTRFDFGVGRGRVAGGRRGGTAREHDGHPGVPVSRRPCVSEAGAAWYARA